MKRAWIRLPFALLLGGPFLFAGVRQVRVTAPRAAIYAEPSRSSTRVDIVPKGTLLNLFQQNKVKNSWYYVSYVSVRFGARTSGFVQDSAVEPVEEEAAGSQALPKPADAPPKPAAPPPPKIVEEKAKVLVTSEVQVATSVPRARRLTLPRRASSIQDLPWAVVQQPVPEPQPAAARPAPPKPAAPLPPLPQPPAAPKEPPAKSEPRSAPQTMPPQPVRPSAEPRRSATLGLGLGFGPSFGGAGGSVQVFLSRNLALHAGYGVYPTTIVYSETDWVKNESLWSAGLRIHPVLSSPKVVPYIDIQYGGFIVEAAQVINGIYDYAFVYDQQQKALWGPSLLVGLELRFGRFALSGGVGGSYSLTEWDVLQSRFFFTFEAGLGVRL